MDGADESTLTVLAVVVLCPLIVIRSGRSLSELEALSSKFKDDTNIIWNKMMSLGQDKGVIPPDSKIQYFSIKKRHAWDKGMCSGCNLLSCPLGLPGNSGEPGVDGSPGESGRPGPAGEDGYDIQIEVEDELPCVICPSGPPGLRGLQGERGMTGEPGHPGQGGEPGNQGAPGVPGDPGPAGDPGIKGPSGPQGQRGDPSFNGVGLKGPKGPIGAAGPKGPPGIPGKRSRDAGENGRPGPPGPPGVHGNAGSYGEEGGWGPPGEPGMPATFCPSDCGVAHILAPTYNQSPQRGGEEYQQPEGIADNQVTAPQEEATPQPVEGYRKYRFNVKRF